MIGGVAVARDPALAERIGFLQNAVGAISGPFDSFLALRGLKTLALRMRQASESAIEIAGWLEKHPQVARVVYPGLPSHPQHELARRQMKNGYSGIVTFFVKGGMEEARVFLERCRVFTIAESLGGVESLVDHPGLMTHASIPPDKRQQLGIDDSLIRLHVLDLRIQGTQVVVGPALRRVQDTSGADAQGVGFLLCHDRFRCAGSVTTCRR